MVSLESYELWARKITSLSCFRQIRSEYHPEIGEYEVGDKCHQPIFLIRCINRATTINVYLGPNAYFDEWYLSARRSF